MGATTIDGLTVTDNSVSVAGSLTVAGVTTLTGALTVTDSVFTIRDDGDTTKQAKFQLSSITTGTTRTLTVPDVTGSLIVDQNTISTLCNTTAACTLNLAASGTLSGNTKTVNLGNGGASGSTSNIQMGPATSGALGTTTFNGPSILFGANATVFRVPDNIFQIADDVDSTKRVNFQVSGVTTATTRLLTVPDASGIIVLDTATQTLTNKTLTTPKFTSYTVAGLPAAGTAGTTARAFVTDALTPTFGATVAGGGAVLTPVYSDGTNWKVG